MVHMLTELSYELLRGKATNQVRERHIHSISHSHIHTQTFVLSVIMWAQISAHYYCEINIYVTAVEKG